MTFNIIDREARALRRILNCLNFDADVHIKLNKPRMLLKLYIQEKAYKWESQFHTDITVAADYVLKLSAQTVKELVRWVTASGSPQIQITVVNNNLINASILSGTDWETRTFDAQIIKDDEAIIVDFDLLSSWKVPESELLLAPAWSQKLSHKETEATLFYSGDCLWEFQYDALPPYMIKVEQQIGTIRSCNLYANAVKYLLNLLSLTRGNGIVAINTHYLTYTFEYGHLKNKFYTPVWNVV